MRKTLGVSLTALTLLFGGAGVAQATTPIGPMPSSTTTTIAADTDDGDSDNTGLGVLQACQVCLVSPA